MAMVKILPPDGIVAARYGAIEFRFQEGADTLVPSFIAKHMVEGHAFRVSDKVKVKGGDVHLKDLDADQHMTPFEATRIVEAYDRPGKSLTDIQNRALVEAAKRMIAGGPPAISLARNTSL